VITGEEKVLYSGLSETIKKQIARMDELDIYTSKHIHSVPQIVANICRKMGYSEEQIRFCVQCAYLHDIGKIFIPSKILQKEGALTDEEFKIMQSHTTAGARLCEAIPEISQYSNAARYHHENNDGSGYPEGITRIPMEAQIVKVADIYDALINKRQYKEKIELTKAIDILKTSLVDRNLANKQVFEALLDVILDGKDLSAEDRMAVLKTKVDLSQEQMVI